MVVHPPGEVKASKVLCSSPSNAPIRPIVAITQLPDLGLITMQPNLNIPLYIVAPNERRDKVVSEINRPTFAKLSPPMAEICRFISFEELRNQLSAVSNVLQYLKPEFLDSFSEGCQIEDV
jgi:hypothetical protein